MTQVLRETESEIWDFPSINQVDDSITKYEYLKVYEDHHGAGRLDEAKSFSFTTENEDLWIIPSKSYLKLNVYLRKIDGTPYIWENVAHRPAVGNAGDDDYQPAVAAVAADDINISDNAYNLFEEARLFLGDQEVERIDYLGITTLMQQLFKTTSDAKQTPIKHKELLFLNEADDRKAYIRNRRGHLHLMLPVSKIFPFYQQNDHVFRGMKHRITFTLNDINRMIKKAQAVDNAKIYIEGMEWLVPYVEPSLSVMTKLETQMAKSNEFSLEWNAINVFKHQPQRNREVRLSLAATVHKPTKVYLALQNINKDTESNTNSMVFDHMDLEELFVEVNSVRFPEKPLKLSYGDDDYMEIYDRFLKECDNKESLIDYENFKNNYAIVCIDVSNHKPELFDTSTFPVINLYMKFNQAPAYDYLAWVLVENERTATLNISDKKMRVIR